MQRNLYVVVILILSLLLTTSQLFAQTPTPTPAPSKTPIMTQEPTNETPSDEDEETSFRTLAQEDLTVITGNVQRPNGMTWFDGKLYVVCSGDWTIYQIDDTTGDTVTYIQGIRNGHAMIAELNEQQSLDLWAPDFDQNTLLKINAARAPQPVASNLDAPWGIARLDDTNFVVSNLGNDSIDQISRDGEITTLLDSLRSPTGVAIDEDYLYIANNGSARRAIEWVNLTEETPSTQALVSGLQSTTGLQLASDGYLYFAYALGTRGVIGRVNPEECRERGGCTNNEVEIVLYTELAAPLAGLTITEDMRLFVHTMFRPEIYWVQLPQE